MRQKVLYLYFEQKLLQKEIAERLNISKYKVSRIVTNDERYYFEKEERKRKSKEKHNKNTKELVKKQREKARFNNVDDLVLKEMHKQASMELSKNSKLSDMAYKKWNTSAYKYNKDKKRFEFREELGRSYDVKKYLKGTI